MPLALLTLVGFIATTGAPSGRNCRHRAYAPWWDTRHGGKVTPPGARSGPQARRHMQCAWGGRIRTRGQNAKRARRRLWQLNNPTGAVSQERSRRQAARLHGCTAAAAHGKKSLTGSGRPQGRHVGHIRRGREREGTHGALGVGAFGVHLGVGGHVTAEERTGIKRSGRSRRRSSWAGARHFGVN